MKVFKNYGVNYSCSNSCCNKCSKYFHTRLSFEFFQIVFSLFQCSVSDGL